MTVQPVRLQLRRTARFNLQTASRAVNGLPARSCARPGPYGNPWVVKYISGCWCVDDPEWFVRHWTTPKPNRRMAHENRRWCSSKRAAVRYAVWCFRAWARNPFILPRWEPLRAHNLACFCGADQPCHVDTLLELANV